MSPEFRYHVASLCAVFFALGIGILVGTAFVGTRIVDRQTGLIGRLEARVDTMRRETRERDRAEEALRLVAPSLVAGRLEGNTVAVVDVGGYPAAGDSAEQALKAAGAQTIRLSLPETAWLEEGEPEAAAQRLAAALVQGQEVGGFEERGLLRGTPNAPLRRCVLVGGLSGTPERTEPVREMVRRRDSALLRELVRRGAAVIAAESLYADVPTLGNARAESVATVDCIDRPVGAIALVWALEKASRGETGQAYGMRDDADMRLPDPAR